MSIIKQAQYALMKIILINDEVNVFCVELREFLFSLTWDKLQSFKTHFKSYCMIECERLSVIMLLLLRTWLQSKWIQSLYLRAAKIIMCMILQLNNFIDCIVSCYAIIAKSNIMILTFNMLCQNAENMRILLHQSRKVFQHLYEYIIITSLFNFIKSIHFNQFTTEWRK